MSYKHVLKLFVLTHGPKHRLSNCEKIDNDQFIIDMLQCPDENKLKNFDNENESNYEDESDKLLEQLCTESIEIST